MHGLRSPFLLVFGFLAIGFLATPSAWAFRMPDPAKASSPTDHEIQLRYADSRTSPYAMNYADEAARNLGIRDGQWEAFKTQSSDSLSFRGGIQSGRPMIGLQWRPD